VLALSQLAALVHSHRTKKQSHHQQQHSHQQQQHSHSHPQQQQPQKKKKKKVVGCSREHHSHRANNAPTRVSLIETVFL
jgi:hypothetical protein